MCSLTLGLFLKCIYFFQFCTFSPAVEPFVQNQGERVSYSTYTLRLLYLNCIFEGIIMMRFGVYRTRCFQCSKMTKIRTIHWKTLNFKRFQGCVWRQNLIPWTLVFQIWCYKFVLCHSTKGYAVKFCVWLCWSPKCMLKLCFIFTLLIR